VARSDFKELKKKCIICIIDSSVYRQPSPEGCLMRKVNKTPKVEAGRDSSVKSARPAIIYIYTRNNIIKLHNDDYFSGWGSEKISLKNKNSNNHVIKMH